MAEAIRLEEVTFLFDENKDLQFTIEDEDGADLSATSATVTIYNSAGAVALTPQNMTGTGDYERTFHYTLTVGAAENLTTIGRYTARYILTYGSQQRYYEQTIYVLLSDAFLSRLDTQLKHDLGGAEVEAYYTPKSRQSALASAIREYSRFHKIPRRFGSGALFAGAQAGAQIVYLLGGPFSAGQTITLSAYTGNAESVVIASVDFDPDLAFWQVGEPVVVTLNAALTRAHRAGAFVAPQTWGLTLQANVDTYVLPRDFVEPEQSSFDVAVGAQMNYSRQGSFYDATYPMVARYTGVGAGSRKTFGYGGANSPLGVGFLAGSISTQTLYRFIESEPKLLTISPAPGGAKTLDFYYLAMHSAQSIPEMDYPLILLYARYVALSAQAAALGALMDYSELDKHETASANARVLQQQADACLTEWKQRLRTRPYITSG